MSIEAISCYYSYTLSRMAGITITIIIAIIITIIIIILIAEKAVGLHNLSDFRIYPEGSPAPLVHC